MPGLYTDNNREFNLKATYRNQPTIWDQKTVNNTEAVSRTKDFAFF